ncbi:hypothetical protein EDC01DRAFT_674257 [Geopyxis carbonaria]|nr:hypothetical protein EDC01DRAFT_674257 [Geopyxis carbonaria]
MRFSVLAAGSLLLAPVLAREIPNPARKAAYDSGAVHAEIMGTKRSSFADKRAAGHYNSKQYKKIQKKTKCRNGKAGEFRCENVDLYSFYSHADLGSVTGEGSSSWGWTHKGREYIIIAQADGASFSEVTKKGQLDYLGRLPNTAGSEPEIWREIRVMDDYAIIGSEAENHYIQIFDLKKLLTIKPSEKPKTFDSISDLTGLFKDLPIGRTHNVVANNDFKYAVSVGAAPRTAPQAGGLIFIDLSDPTNPTSPGYQAQDGYVHDAQCLRYRGPDTKYAGADICYGYNEDTLTIYDVTNKANASIISRTGYEGAAYTHQGWVLDPNNQHYLLMDDEYDEYDHTGAAADGFATTYIWDISSLEAPKQTGFYKSPQYSIDHNQYIANGKAFQSHYGAGLRILDVSSIPDDPTGSSVEQLGFFDVYPEDDGEDKQGVLDFVGSWSSYALFESGFIVVNTIERGAFVVKYTGK